jgi:hypothetical protein
MKAALLRLVRILVAQIPALIAYLNGLGSPLWLMVGAIINAVAKYLRDRYKWEWLPV